MIVELSSGLEVCFIDFVGANLTDQFQERNRKRVVIDLAAIKA
jgi:hypothetical protein